VSTHHQDQSCGRGYISSQSRLPLISATMIGVNNLLWNL
jgi:hypothetical protein